MATLYGRSIRWYDTFNDMIQGTAAADTIYGLGGNDVIWASAGTDFVYGGAGNDQIFGTHSITSNYLANWGTDYVQGGSGNDYIDYSRTLDRVTLYGDDGGFNALTDGADRIFGGYANDVIYGGGGNDMIRGGAGVDQIYGDTRNNPGAGDDMIIGDTGADILTGGNGHDTFVYFWGDSFATAVGHDVITDFNHLYDKIDVPGWGTAGNYYERTITGTSSRAETWQIAKDAAAYDMRNFPKDDIVFITDGKNGYLFVDTDADNVADIGIELLGVKALAQFAYSVVV